MSELVETDKHGLVKEIIDHINTNFMNVLGIVKELQSKYLQLENRMNENQELYISKINFLVKKVTEISSECFKNKQIKKTDLDESEIKEISFYDYGFSTIPENKLFKENQMKTLFENIEIEDSTFIIKNCHLTETYFNTRDINEDKALQFLKWKLNAIANVRKYDKKLRWTVKRILHKINGTPSRMIKVTFNQSMDIESLRAIIRRLCCCKIHWVKYEKEKEAQPIIKENKKDEIITHKQINHNKQFKQHGNKSKKKKFKKKTRRK